MYLGNESQGEPVAELGADVPLCAVEAGHRALLGFVVAQDADKDPGVAEVRSYLDVRDRHEADARILQVAPDDLTGLGPDNPGEPLGAHGRHRRLPLLSNLNLKIQQDDFALALDEILDPGQDRVCMPGGGCHAGETDRCPPPLVLVVYLRSTDSKPVLRSFNKALDKTALVLQAAGARQTQLGFRDADDDRPLLLRPWGGVLRRHLLDFIRLDQIALLDVVEALQADAALIPIGDFSNVLLETPQ